MLVKPHIVALLIGSHVLVAAIGVVAYGLSLPQDYNLPPGPPHTVYDSVLDGDTVVIGGTAIHVRGMDAPELGPWAHCWAEAALAGNARQTLESELNSDIWTPVDRRTDTAGHVSARFLNKGGFDITDNMMVSGVAAVTDAPWNWCGTDVDLKAGYEAKGPPKGPGLWWPSNQMYDPRAAD